MHRWILCTRHSSVHKAKRGLQAPILILPQKEKRKKKKNKPVSLKKISFSFFGGWNWKRTKKRTDFGSFDLKNQNWDLPLFVVSCFSNPSVVVVLRLKEETMAPMNQRKEESVVVAIDKDKGSQYALKWAVDNLLGKARNVTLLHVIPRQPTFPGIHFPLFLYISMMILICVFKKIIIS